MAASKYMKQAPVRRLWSVRAEGLSALVLRLLLRRWLAEHRGAVGDVCLNFFDADGAHVVSDLGDRTLGIDEATLKAIPRRIGVAGGRRKHAAIRAALVGGWCDVLITDSATAEVLLAD